MLRKITFVLSIALALGLWIAPASVSAQDEPQKRENVDYYRVVHLNFKPGHNTEAWAILYGKIGTAVRSMGRDFIVLDWDSGPWDSTLYIRQDDGYDSLEYAQSPQNVAFRAALAEQEGSEEAAQAVMDEWTSHIANSSTAIAHMHNPPSDDE